MALLHLLAGRGDVHAVTVDHGLRPEAAAEAVAVAAICAGLGVPHATLHWRWDQSGNLSDRARRGRITLISEWARARGILTVALGHTADDQAETVLMRVARGSGVDGLCGMARQRVAGGVTWVRPLLGVRRDDLRAYLRRRGVTWFDDPGNQDTRYLRVRTRAALEVLEPLGITVGRLAATAQHLALAREALQQAAQDAARRICRIDSGDVVFDRQGLALLPSETQLRLLAHAVGWVASAEYRPRFQTLIAVHAALAQGKRRTLGGCLLMPTKCEIRVTREVQAVQRLTGPTEALWDQRWQFSGPHSSGLHVAALSATGLAHCPDWRQANLPRSSLLASPAIWRGAVLIAAPLAGLSNGWRAMLACDDDAFFRSLLSH